MTLLEMASLAARNAGFEAPELIVGSSDQTAQDVLAYANRTGEEMHRRVDWGGLVKTTTINGTGLDAAHALPADFARLSQGVTVTGSGGVVRPMSRAEWGTLVPTAGDPRYFLLENDTLRLWPYLAAGQSVSVTYISENWTATASSFQADDDETVFDPDTFVSGLVVRWRRDKGMDYADFEAEYEASLAQHAMFDDRARF